MMPKLTAAASTIAIITQAITGGTAVPPPDLLAALALLHQLKSDLEAIEPILIAAARQAGVSWHALAPALGVASRQAAERRYLRLIPATAEQSGTTRDERVRAERDRRAGRRAVAAWANAHTADLRQLAARITTLTNLDPAATNDIERLHAALADADATTLPALLAAAQQHLGGHQHIADQVDAVTAHTERVRRNTQRHRGQAVNI
jgi:hypothetical protein